MFSPSLVQCSVAPPMPPVLLPPPPCHSYYSKSNIGIIFRTVVLMFFYHRARIRSKWKPCASIRSWYVLHLSERRWQIFIDAYGFADDTVYIWGGIVFILGEFLLVVM